MKFIFDGESLKYFEKEQLFFMLLTFRRAVVYIYFK
jgi:hypothetical protein